MAVDIGPKIGIEGEQKFRQELNNVNQAVKTLGSEMKAVTSEFSGQEKSMESLTKQNAVLDKTILTLNDKLKLQQQALKESADKYGEADTRTMKWQQAVNETTAAINKAEAEYKQNAQAIDQIGDEANETAKQLDDAAKSGKSFGEKLATGVKAAAKVVAGLATAAAGASTAVIAMTTKAARSADDINTLSKQTGLTTEQIQKFQYASELIDVDLDTLTGSMAKLTKNMSTASKGTGDAATAFEALGINITDANGELRNNQDVFNEAIDALGKIENETQRDAYAMAIFGKSAQDLNPLILGGADALEELGKQAEDAGLILEQDSLDKLNMVSDAMDTLKSTVTGAGSAFSVSFAEPIANGVNTITGYVQKLTSAFSSGGFSALSDALSTVLLDLTGKINEYLPQIMEFGTQIIMNLAMGIISMLPDIISTGITVITTLINSIAEMLPELIPVAVEALITIVETLIDNVDMLVDSAIAIITALAEGLINALPKLIEKAPEIIQKLVTAIINNAPKLISAAFEIIVKLVSGIISNLPKVLESAGRIISMLITGLRDGLKKVVDIGKQIVEGVWQGIKNAAAAFTANVKNFFSNIVKSVKKALGIKSPSKVFAGIGTNMVAGLEQGWDSEFSHVQRTIDDSINGLAPSASVAVNASGSTDITGAVQMALSGAAVYLDGNKVGKIIFTRQNNETIARGMSPVYA